MIKMLDDALKFLNSGEKKEIDKIKERLEKLERQRREPQSLEKIKKKRKKKEESGKEKKNKAYHVTWGKLGKQKKRYPACPHCSKDDKVIKRGKRKKKHETVQLYKCKRCSKTFTPKKVKGKHFPLRVVFDGLSFYNLGYNLENSCNFLKRKYDLEVASSTLSNWVDEFKDTCTYHRIRRFGKGLYDPEDILVGINLYHRQIYKFRIHRAKLDLLLKEDIRHHKFTPLKKFLEAVFQECPHYLFRSGQRASECKINFDLSQVLIHKKKNYANRLASLVLSAVKENKLRHEALQQFFLCNDTATVATEVPVYLLPEDVEHMENELDFKIPLEIKDVLSGHIDLVQLRNNAVHILDYKPEASKEKPITQLTLYALAMSRLTGLRLYSFKCGWFDKHDYYEFFPLHVVYKLKKHQRSHPPDQKKLIKAKNL